MTAPTTDGTASGTQTPDQAGQNGAQSASTAAPTADAGQPGTSGQASPQGEPQDVASLPQWAQNIIHSTRSEAATHRQAKSAAEQERDGIREAAKVALGLAEAPSADQLGEQLAQSRTETRQARVEVAIARGAGAHGADPDALLDSRTFLASVADLDPAAADFQSKVGDAIKAAVEANGKLKAAAPATAGTQTATGPAPDPSQGSSGTNPPAKGSLEAGAAAYEARFGRTTTTTA